MEPSSSKSTKQRYKTRKCPDCSSIPSSAYLWKAHRVAHGDGELFSCLLCDRSFVTSCKLKRHVTGVHETKKSFACPHPGCSFRSASRILIRDHKQEAHRNDPAYACRQTGCSYKTERRNNLDKHFEQAHSNVRRFACSHGSCSYAAKTRNHLQSHLQQVVQ